MNVKSHDFKNLSCTLNRHMHSYICTWYTYNIIYHVGFVSLLYSVNNRCEVLEVTADVQVKCEELGRVLDLDRSVVSKISRDNPSILQRHYEIMKCWIKNSGASWKKLVHALRSQLLEEKEVAQEIAKKYLGKC